MKRILDLSGQCIPFKQLVEQSEKNLKPTIENVEKTRCKTKYYYEPNCSHLPFGNQSFDFSFSRERDSTRMFVNPLTSLNELMRVSKTGIIQSVSPLETLLLNRDATYITWTEPFFNRLCILPYYGMVPLRNRSQWMDLLNFNHLYKNNYYYWSNPLEINVQTFFRDELEYEEYEYILNLAVEQSVAHTRHFIEQYLDIE
jgi:ubiquinone/menaquinone biosynthesis C-methylase UbiE